MKQQFLLLITLLMIASQAFAQGIKMDSLSRGHFVESDRRLGGDDEGGDSYKHDPSGYSFIDGDFFTADFIVPVDTENGTNATNGTDTNTGTITVPMSKGETYTLNVWAPYDVNPFIGISQPSGFTFGVSYSGTQMYRAKKYDVYTFTVKYAPNSYGSGTFKLTIVAGCRINGSAPKANNTYYKFNGSYLPTPQVSVSPSSLYFSKYSTKPFYVKGYNLLKGLTARLAGTGKGYFSLSKSSISKSDASNGVYVNVTCNPTSTLQKATARVEILHANKVVATVYLYYVKGGMVEIGSVPMPEDEDAAEENVEETAVENSQEVWGNAVTGVEELSMSARVYADGQNIVIESPVEQSAIISDISGRAQRVNLMAGINVIPASTSGIHIVRVGEKTVKVMLR